MGWREGDGGGERDVVFGNLMGCDSEYVCEWEYLMCVGCFVIIIIIARIEGLD